MPLNMRRALAIVGLLACAASLTHAKEIFDDKFLNRAIEAGVVVEYCWWPGYESFGGGFGDQVRTLHIPRASCSSCSTYIHAALCLVCVSLLAVRAFMCTTKCV